MFHCRARHGLRLRLVSKRGSSWQLSRQSAQSLVRGHDQYLLDHPWWIDICISCICISISLSIDRSIHLSLHPSIHLSMYRYTYNYIYIFILKKKNRHTSEGLVEKLRHFGSFWPGIFLFRHFLSKKERSSKYPSNPSLDWTFSPIPRRAKTKRPPPAPATAKGAAITVSS